LVSAPASSLVGDWMMAYSRLPSAAYSSVVRPMSEVSMSPVGVIALNEPAPPPLLDS